MSTLTGIDIRYPIGGLFTALGLLIGGYGVATAGGAVYARLNGLNVNLGWGFVMLAFGLFCLWLARRAEKAPTVRPSGESAEGRAVEQSEARRGLERNP